MPNYTKTVTVRVTGKSCSVVFDTQLDPGEAYYRTGSSSHTKPKMIDPVCTVEDKDLFLVARFKWSLAMYKMRQWEPGD